MHVISLHVADGGKIKLRLPVGGEVDYEEWKQETNEVTGDTYHRISAEEHFGVVLKDKSGKFIAMVHSKLER